MSEGNEPSRVEPEEGQAFRFERACDEYLEAMARGVAEDLDVFCARYGDASGELRRRIEGFRHLVTEVEPGPAARTPAPTAPGGLPFERLGDFRLIRRLAEGGMGFVFLAEQESLHRLVALKVGRPERAGSPEAQARLKREALAAAKLRHPNIVAVHAMGEADGVRYLAMELVPGKGLDEILHEHALRGERIPSRTSLQWIAAIARAIECAHGAGVLHRDVKPSNVRITPEGRPVLVDFGLARLQRSGDLTLAGEFRGTPRYASPEQVAAERVEIDARTDVYSLGVTLYECATGRVPFEGETTDQVFSQILWKEPPPPRRLNPAIPRDLETVILTAMDKDRDLRYPSIAAFADDLEALLELRPIRAKPAGALTRAMKWTRRNRRTSLAAGIAAVALLLLPLVHFGREIAHAHRFRSEMSAGEDAAARGDADAALGAFDRALALRPDDATLLRRRASLERERNEARSHAAIDEARRRLKAYEAERASAAALRERIEAARSNFEWSPLSPAEREAHHRDREEMERVHLRLEEAYAKVADALEEAGRYDPENPRLPDARAEVYFERWEEAVSSGDSAGESFFCRKVIEHDREGRWREQLVGDGTIELAGSPHGTEVFLFRYELQSRLWEGGERRLVPVPFHPGRGRLLPESEREGIRPGDVVWVVEAVEPGSPASLAGIRAGDLISRIEDRPLEATILVSEVLPAGAGGRAGLRLFDRLVRFQGRDVLGEEGVLRAYHEDTPQGDTLEAVFARGTTEIAVSAPKSGKGLEGDLGLRFALPEALLSHPAPETGLRLTVGSDGETREVAVDGGARSGLSVTRTAYPLLRSAENGLGRLPLSPFRAAPGSYLFSVHADGFEDLVLPVLLERGGRASPTVELLPVGSTPPGFAWIPPGPFVAGGDPEAHSSEARATRDLPGFWIGRREVTRAEYLEFLNDPTTRAEVVSAAAKGRIVRVPRSPSGAILCSRDAAGNYAMGSASSPIASISPQDALAYCAWRTTRARLRGEPWAFDLPSEAQWEKAARGADGRRFPWGDTFDWGFCHGDLSLPRNWRSAPLPGTVRDASPFGVLDLAGSMSEWCGGRGKYANSHPLRGGSWANELIHVFRAAHRDYYNPDTVYTYYGFRIVARRAGAN